MATDDDALGSDGGPETTSTRLTRKQVLEGAAAGAAVVAFGLRDGKAWGSTAAPAAAKPKTGGVLKVALSSGGATDTLDPHFTIDNFADSARFLNLYDQLIELDAHGTPRLALAEELSHNK